MSYREHHQQSIEDIQEKLDIIMSILTDLKASLPDIETSSPTNIGDSEKQVFKSPFITSSSDIIQKQLSYGPVEVEKIKKALSLAYEKFELLESRIHQINMGGRSRIFQEKGTSGI